MAADGFTVSVRCYGPAERAAGTRTVDVVGGRPAPGPPGRGNDGAATQ